MTHAPWSYLETLAIVIIVSVVVGSAQAQSKGLALVIGNTDYTSGKLSNAANDAKDIAIALGDLGFEVTLKEDLNLQQFSAVVSSFQTEVAGKKELALFYYSGHAIQVNGENYLIPLGTAIRDSQDVPGMTIPLQRVFDALGGHSGANIIILDSCRTNPFATPNSSWTPGLATPTNPPPNSVIEYSTSPGTVAADGTGTHSPFTRALIKFMRVPGLTVPTLFSRIRSDVQINTDGTQVPWEDTSLSASVFLRNPVYFQAQFTSSADDDAIVLVNGDVVLDWNQDGASKKQIELPNLDNDVVVRVYNQRSYTGGIPGLGGHLPEGWRYDLRLTRNDSDELIHLSGKEDVPSDNGPHHGKLFTVATLHLHIDERTGFLRVTTVDPVAWTH